MPQVTGARCRARARSRMVHTVGPRISTVATMESAGASLG